MTSPRPDAPSPQPLSRKAGEGLERAGEGLEREGEEERTGANAFLLEADWDAPANVRAFTTLRFGAGSSRAPFDSFNLGNARAADGDDPGIVAANRAELVARAQLPSPPRWLRQVHGTRVLRFEASPSSAARASTPSPPAGGEGRGGVAWAPAPPDGRAGSDGTPSQPPPASAGGGATSAGSSPFATSTASAAATASAADTESEADAAVTSTPGVVLAILTADCLPVVFAARGGGEVGVAHAGWRGLVAGVLENTVAAMRSAPGDLVAWLGPAAGPRAYEVGAEVFEAFTARDPRAAAAFAPTRPGHWRVDLYALARQRLADAGVARVHGGGLCTISEPQRFFSHRRDGRSGRIATLAWIA